MQNPQNVVSNFPTQQPLNLDEPAAEVRPLSWTQFQEKFKFPVTAATRMTETLDAAAVQSRVDVEASFEHGRSATALSLFALALGRYAASGVLATARYAVSSTIEGRIYNLPETLKNRATELSREYGIREDLLTNFLNECPTTLEECLQFPKYCIDEPRLRLVIGNSITTSDLESFEIPMGTNKEIIIAKSNGSLHVCHRHKSLTQINVFRPSDTQLEDLLAPFSFKGQLLPYNQSTEALYRYVYQKVGSNNGCHFEYSGYRESVEGSLVRYLKTRVLLGLDPKELIDRRGLCIQTAYKYPNEEAVAYINTLEVEESRKSTLSACQPALSALEDSSASPMLFSERGTRLASNNAKAISGIVCDYLYGPSTLEAEYAPLRRR